MHRHTDSRHLVEPATVGTDIHSCRAALDTELRVAAAFYSLTPNPHPPASLAHSSHITRLWPLITLTPDMENAERRLPSPPLCLHSFCLLPLSQHVLLPVSPCPAPASELLALSDPTVALNEHPLPVPSPPTVTSAASPPSLAS